MSLFVRLRTTTMVLAVALVAQHYATITHRNPYRTLLLRIQIWIEAIRTNERAHVQQNAQNFEA